MGLPLDYTKWYSQFYTDTDYIKETQTYLNQQANTLGLDKANTMISIGAGMATYILHYFLSVNSILKGSIAKVFLLTFNSIVSDNFYLLRSITSVTSKAHCL